MRKIVLLHLLLLLCLGSVYSQSQSWQWIKAGGSNNDNLGAATAKCQVSGCDAKGNVYAMGYVNGPNMVFDTFSSPGTYGANGINELVFSYDCSGKMRWAKQIGDVLGSLNTALQGIATDVQGNTFLYAVYQKGFRIGDTVIDNSIVNNFYEYLTSDSERTFSRY